MMTLQTSAPTHLARTAIGALTLATTLLLGVPLPAEAQSRSQQQVSIRGQDAGQTARRLDLSIGKSLIVDLPRDAAEVFVANPKIANAVVRSARKLFIIGVEDGATSIFAMDSNGNQIANLEIVVGRDLNVLRQAIRTALPRTNIEIRPAGDSIILLGKVGTASDAQQAVDIANAFVGISAGSGGARRGAVINSLTIAGRDQVMLKVTVAEVSRQALKQLGINSQGEWRIGNFSLTPNLDNPLTVASQALSNTTIGAAIGGASNNFTLRALERAGLSRTLAEPTLTAISGESAKFTAGGELAVPSNQTCTPGATPGAQPVCTVGVEFKPFGVTLNFTPIVMSEGRISLRVATEVTEIDIENQVRFQTVNVPGFRVRKAETTVEMPSGASMVTAGLIQQTSKQAINGFPGLVNLPVIGALFRSRDYQRNETELMIMVTPYLAKPAEARQLPRPDDGFVDAHDAQAILLGRLNRLYGSGSPQATQGFKGRVGFIAD